VIGLLSKSISTWLPASSQLDGNPGGQALSRAWQPRILQSRLSNGRVLPNGPREQLLTTTTNSPGTLFNSKPTSHVLFPHQHHQQQQQQHQSPSRRPRRLCVHFLTRQGCPSADTPTSAAYTQTRLQPNHTPTRRESSVGKDRRVPVRQPQVSPSAISHSCLASITKAISLSFRPISPCFNALICQPRPNVKRGGQSPWCCGPPSTQSCISNSTPSTTYISSAQHVFRV
jgi:hypothetical protein